MTCAHHHKLKLLTLCNNHSDAINIMTEMYKRFHDTSDYYKLCSELEKNKLYGSAIHHIWKHFCSENYDTFLTFPISSIIENLKNNINKNFW
jgi:hypothetical protein